MNEVCTHMADIDYGELRVYPGNYDDYMTAATQARERQQALNNKKKAEMFGGINQLAIGYTQNNQYSNTSNQLFGQQNNQQNVYAPQNNNQFGGNFGGNRGF